MMLRRLDARLRCGLVQQWPAVGVPCLDRLEETCRGLRDRPALGHGYRSQAILAGDRRKLQTSVAVPLAAMQAWRRAAPAAECEQAAVRVCDSQRSGDRLDKRAVDQPAVQHQAGVDRCLHAPARRQGAVKVGRRVTVTAGRGTRVCRKVSGAIR